jgi:hypothetical protein
MTWNLLETGMKLSDADYLRLRRAISLEQLIMRSEPFDRPLTAACTLASSIKSTTAACKAATTDASGTTPYGANDNAVGGGGGAVAQGRRDDPA